MATKYGMLIDLAKCTGCGTCAIACKTENNTRHEDTVNGRKYNWADFYVSTEGKFPDTKFTVVPVLCNHCGDKGNEPPCIIGLPGGDGGCPVARDTNGNKAIFKTDTGITMRDESRCIGCQRCIGNCPYSAKDVNASAVQYSVNSFNPVGTATQPFWNDTTAFVTGGTSTPKEVVTKAGFGPPNKNEYTHKYYNAVRYNKDNGVTEKCYFCDHRLQNGDQPYCVVSCPAVARVFGDQNDPSSEISQLLAANGSKRLKNNKGEFLAKGDNGSSPNVYYLNDFSGNVTGVEEKVAEKGINLRVYPNPVRDNAIVEFELEKPSSVVLSLYDISGREVQKLVENRSTGRHSISINVSDLAAGTYICTLMTNGVTMSSSNIIVAR